MEVMEFYRDNLKFQLNYYLKHRMRSASEMNELPLELRLCVSYKLCPKRRNSSKNH